MNQFAYILAWRYLTQKNQNTRMKIMLSTCFFGIFIGSFALCLVLSIMNGFQVATHKQLKSINPELELHAFGQELQVSTITNVLEREFPEIIAASSYDTQQGLVFTPCEESPTTLVIIKGIDPYNEEKVSLITEKIIKPAHQTITTTLQHNAILIGKQLAQDLSLTIKDHINLYFTTQKTRSKKINLSQKSLVIGGIFSTGIEEFDSNLIICDLKTLTSMFPHTGPTHISLRLQPSTDIELLKKKLHTRLTLQAVSWQDRYPAIMAALQLEKYAMFFILALIILVASMNIIALLSMHISSKRTDIAILRAMGIPLTTIKHVFILFGLIIASTATIIGIMCASIISWVIEQYPCITLPDVYYVSTLPANMEMSIAVLVFCVVIIVTCFALAIAIRMINTIHITQVLRFEA